MSLVRVLYLVTYRVYEESIICKSLTQAFFALVPRNLWPNKKVFLCKAILQPRKKWGFEVIPQEFPKDISPPREIHKDFEKLKELIRKHADFESIIEVLRRLENFGFMSTELEKILNEWWKKEEFALMEGYRYKCAWILKWLERNPINALRYVRNIYSEEWKGVRKLIIEFSNNVLKEPRIIWLMRRLCFRNKRTRYGYSPFTFEIVEDHLANHFPIICVLFPAVLQHLNKFPYAQEKIKLMWEGITTWELPEITFESEIPATPLSLSNINPFIHLIIEVDLGRVVYFSVIAQAFQNWDESGYPRRVYYFSRDTQLSFLLRPGDLVLAQITMAHGKNTFIVKPLQKISLEDALNIIKQHPDIRVICFDKPLDLYQKLINNITSLIRQEEVLQELKDRKPILDSRGFEKIAEKIKNEISKYRENLEKRKIDLLIDAIKKVRDAYQIPNVRKIAKVIFKPEITLLRDIGFSDDESLEIILTVITLAKTKEKFKNYFWKLAKQKIKEYILTNWKRNWNVKLLNSIYPNIAKELVKKRVEEFKKAPILKRRLTTGETYWDASLLAQTYYGRKILSALRISDPGKIDEVLYRQLREILDEIGAINEIDLAKFEIISLSQEEIKRVLESSNIEETICEILSQKIFSLFRFSSTSQLKRLNVNGISENFLKKLRARLFQIQREKAEKLLNELLSTYSNPREKLREIKIILSEIFSIRNPFSNTISIIPTLKKLFFILKPTELLAFLSNFEIPSADDWIELTHADAILEKLSCIVENPKLTLLDWKDYAKLMTFYVIKREHDYVFAHIKASLNGIPYVSNMPLSGNEKFINELREKLHLTVKIIDKKSTPREIPEVIFINKNSISVSFPTVPYLEATKDIKGSLDKIREELTQRGIRIRRYFALGVPYKRGKVRAYTFTIAKLLLS